MAMGEATKNRQIPPTGHAPGIVWDTSNMRSTYANVINVGGDRAEFSLLFGMNQSWGAEQKAVKVQLTDRIVINPFAAKRLAKILNDAVNDYESRYGSIHIQTNPPAPAGKKKISSKGSRPPTVHQAKVES